MEKNRKKEIRPKILKYAYEAIVLICVLIFAVKFVSPSLLRLYIETGVGDCKKIPIFCMVPMEEIRVQDINAENTQGLIPYKFPTVNISAPDGFSVINEKFKKIYYKAGKRQEIGPTIYIFYKGPNYFVDLFPRIKKQGIDDNYKFLERTMNAQLKNIKNLTDVFFVIMKGIFIPDLGVQTKAKMATFIMGDKKGFINYNLSETDNYFDCNILNNEGGFLKVYIKDKGARLTLDRVFAIISTVEKGAEVNSLDF